MMALISGALRLRLLVVALSIVLMIVGVRRARGDAPLDVFPEFAPPLVEIQTEAPGLSTEEVESLVTVPLENALNGTLGLKTHPLEVGARAVVGRADLRGGHRPDAGPAARAGAAGGRGATAARGRPGRR